MPANENFAERTGLAPREPSYRLAPRNIEAEQALLGAILVNNDAFDRVSDFLRPEHFFEEIHRRIYEIAGPLIRAGKIASPITLKTFLGEHDLGGAHRAAISGAPRRRGDDDHQRRGLRPHDPRSGDPARPDPHRRGHRQRRL